MRIRSVTALLLFVVPSAMIVASTPAGAILGTTVDSSGAVVAGAIVTARNLENGTSRSTLTNEVGAYRVGGLPAGRYDVEASFPKFRIIRETGVVLRVGEEARINLTLAPGDVTETVVVVADPFAVQIETAGRSTVVNQTEVAELPLNGRQLQNLALLVPGVAAGWNWSDAANRYGKSRENLEGAFVVNGARGRSNNFVVDGMPMNLRQYGVINFEPSVEAVREFELRSSAPPAEFGRTMGSTVNIVTRSGGERFHGALYEFLRNDTLDANDTFSKRAGLPRGKLRQNQFGGSLGGPLYKQKHFFFANAEFLRNIGGVETRLTSVPTSAERQGLIGYTGTNGLARTLDLSRSVAPASEKLLGFYPQPNTAGPSGLNYNSALAIALKDYQFHIRTDHYLSSRDLVTVRTSWNLNDQEYLVNRFGGPFIPGFTLPNPERTTNGTLGYIRSFNANLQNEARIGVNRYGNLLGNGDKTDAGSLGLPNGAGVAGMPYIAFTTGTLESLGGQPWLNREQNELTVLASDTLSYLRGRHTFKLGGEVTRLHYNTRGAFNERGTLFFDGSQNGLIPRVPGNERAGVLADFLLGRPFQASIVVGQFGRGYRQWYYVGFAEDSWKATDRLTVNLGLRYEYSAPWTEVNGQISNFVPGSGIVHPGSPDYNGFYNWDRNNLAPRVGFAYDVGGRSRTVIRAGFGILYETLLQANSVELIENNPPFAASAVTRDPSPFSPASAPSRTLLDLRSQAQPSRSIGAVNWQGFRNPYAMQYSLGVQHHLGSGWVAEVSYLGTRGVKLPMFVNINQVPIADLSTGQIFQLRQAVEAGRDTTPVLDGLRPFPGLDSITTSQNVASSTYHSAQFKVERRFGRGLNVLASYTVSKSIDNASDFNSADPSEQVLNSRDLRLQRGLSSFDIPQRFSAAFNYDLPLGRLTGGRLRRLAGGWQVNGILTLQSGQPFTPFTSRFDPFRNEAFNRPDVVGDPHRDVPAGHAFNPAAFRAPEPGTFGSAGRNIVRGDGYHSLDLSLFRTIAVREGVRLQLRLESVNSLNHVNYQGPVVNLTSTPGLYVASAPPRIVQIGARLSF